MGHAPNDDVRIREAMEACRPGTDDLRDPDLAFLADRMTASPQLRGTFERLQHWDEKVRDVFGEIPVPEGLADRILAGLASTPGAPASPDPDEAAKPSLAEPAAWRASRRRILALFGGLSAAAAALLGFALWPESPPALTPADVSQWARSQFPDEVSQPGHLVAENPPSSDFPAGPDFDLARFPRMKWRWIKFHGYDGVAYDLRSTPGRRATLYVVRCVVPDLPAIPPPPEFTGDLATGVWQSGALLYVLAVEGPRGTYESLMPPRTLT